MIPTTDPERPYDYDHDYDRRSPAPLNRHGFILEQNLVRAFDASAPNPVRVCRDRTTKAASAPGEPLVTERRART